MQEKEFSLIEGENEEVNFSSEQILVLMSSHLMQEVVGLVLAASLKFDSKSLENQTFEKYIF